MVKIIALDTNIAIDLLNAKNDDPLISHDKHFENIDDLKLIKVE